MTINSFQDRDKLESAQVRAYLEIVDASVPRGCRDLIVSRLNQEFKNVLRWSEVGQQFNLGQWVRDHDWQIDLLNGNNVRVSRHMCNIYYSLKNFTFISVIIPILIINGKLHDLLTNKCHQNRQSWRIGYSVSGKNPRTVTIDDGEQNNQSFSIVFTSVGYISPSVFRIFSFSDYFSALNLFLMSLRRLNMVKAHEISYFFKEILDSHCFLHSMISFSASRNEIGIISVVSEGFPREKCLSASEGIHVDRVNVSPSINLQRPNTLFWSGVPYLSQRYEVEGKKLFLKKLPIYEKRSLDLKGLIEELKACKSRIVLVTGYSLRSYEKMRSVYLLLKSKLGDHLEIVLRDHPRRVSEHQIDPDNNDIVLACVTTQFAINRHLKCRMTINFHIATNEEFIWDPAPYLKIPLVVEPKSCM